MKRLIFPLLSTLVFYIGNSIMFTLLAISLDKANVSINIIGALTTAYYIGCAIGVFTLSKIILKVGHIRAFTGFSAGIIITFIIHGIILDTYLWLFLRLAAGILIGGLLLTIESWMISVSNNHNRGRILAFYMVALYLGYILGQLCFELPISQLKLFSLAAIASAAAIIPLAITNVPQPQLAEPEFLSWRKLYQASNVGLVSVFSSGLMVSVIYGLLPVFFLSNTTDIASVGLYMAVTFIGGMLLQYPIGKLSDQINRPLLTAIIYLFIIILSFLIILLIQYTIAACILLFLFGGLTFAIYPISVSHACDKLDDKQYLSGTQSLLLFNTTGAAIGPMLAPFFMTLIGSIGLFIYFITISSLLTLFIGYFRLSKGRLKKPEEPFIAIPMGTTHIATQIEPRINK